MRVVILTSSSQGTASRCLPTLADSERVQIAAVIQASRPVSRSTRHITRKLKKIAKIGFLGAVNGVRIRPWFDGPPTEALETICGRQGIGFHRVEGVNSQETCDIIAQCKVDLGLSLGNSYISRRVFSLPRLGMINFHGERLPEYQNAQSVIWPIYNMETLTGLTIHQIDDRIDAGPILYKETYPIDFRASLEETVRATVNVTAERLPQAIRAVCENIEQIRANAVPQGPGQSYTTPSFRQFLTIMRNNRRLYISSRKAETHPMPSE